MERTATETARRQPDRPGVEVTEPVRTVPGVSRSGAAEVIGWLHHRLASLLDLSLTLKHVHWNVTGPSFVGVHQLLDDHTAAVRSMADEVAERIRTLGGAPRGTPAAVVGTRDWDDYPLVVAPVSDHIRALDRVLDGVILDHRRAMVHVAPHDPVTEDLLTAQTARLELIQWFYRSIITGPQPDADRRGFGAADRPPTDEESRAADRAPELTDENAERYREMARIGATTEGEGRVP